MTRRPDPIAGSANDPAPLAPIPMSTVGERLRFVAAVRAEEALEVLPKITQRLAALLLVLAICIPVFGSMLICTSSSPVPVLTTTRFPS